MPWAKNEPEPIRAKVERIKWNKEIEEDKDYTLGIFDKVSGNFYWFIQGIIYHTKKSLSKRKIFLTN
ncbi:MAG: hypothetical protein R2836_01975 [Chitinophagales bacterium]